MEQLLWILGTTAVLLAIGGGIGHLLQHLHFESIRAREAETRALPTLNFMPTDWPMTDASLVRGSTVVSIDYLKRFLSWFRSLVGGRMKSIEPMLERGRREAILRMQEAAMAAGADAVVNVRLETSRLANARGDMKGTTGIELVAYGTAVRRA